jgi:SOS-response transcriptional repressor LexA
MAGKPVEVFEPHQRLPIAPWLLWSGAHVVTAVRGDSMIDAGMYEGDLVILLP